MDMIFSVLRSTATEPAAVFALVFVVVWLGAIFVTLNASLLGGQVYVLV
jgi:hypothetical protein